jgi:hypothetical protein
MFTLLPGAGRARIVTLPGVAASRVAAANHDAFPSKGLQVSIPRECPPRKSMRAASCCPGRCRILSSARSSCRRFQPPQAIGGGLRRSAELRGLAVARRRTACVAGDCLPRAASSRSAHRPAAGSARSLARPLEDRQPYEGRCRTERGRLRHRRTRETAYPLEQTRLDAGRVRWLVAWLAQAFAPRDHPRCSGHPAQAEGIGERHRRRMEYREWSPLLSHCQSRPWWRTEALGRFPMSSAIRPA